MRGSGYPIIGMSSALPGVRPLIICGMRGVHICLLDMRFEDSG